jgi:hypothetical protein
MSTQTAPDVVVRRNPYRGPREFGRGDRLPNRMREAQELTDRVIADRVVLLHSPSGAGKTSLIEAAVVPRLAEEGFVATPRLRVNDPGAGDGVNVYVHSAVTYLFTGSPVPQPPAGTTLKSAVKLWADGNRGAKSDESDDEIRNTVVVFDQLEEVLILDPTDWSAQEEFFRQLGDLLATEPVWALLSMREDYMGGLDRYLRLLPGMLQSRYRLDLLTPADAKLAIQVPAQEQHVDFTDDAVKALVEKLAVIRVQQPGQQIEFRRAPYVEPVQLQVVCRQLWRKVRKERPDFTTVEIEDVRRHADIEKALTGYYTDIIRNVVSQTGADERTIRDWIETELITREQFRSQTAHEPAVAETERVISLLQDGYLVRGDVRGTTTWYELSHDRLVRPVLLGNDGWRRQHLEQWQIDAHDWNRHDRLPAFLLQPNEMPSPGARRVRRLTPLEQAFLAESEKEIARRGNWARLRTMRAMLLILVAVVLVETAIIIALVLSRR